MILRRMLLLLALLLIFATTLAPNTSLAGGFSGSGGGSGVLCFDKPELATKADVWIKQNKAIPEDLLSLGRLRVLEAWEMEQTGQEIWPARPTKPWQEILEEVEKVLRADFPLFMYRLDQVGDWAKLQTWGDVEEIPLIEDATPIKPIPTDVCRRVQIVVRDSDGNNPMGEGPTLHHPVVHATFVKRYMGHLPEVDIAMLVLHEKLYMLAQAVGHQSSDRIRGFVRIFFSGNAWKMQGQPGKFFMDREGALFNIKLSLILIFGDYIHFFSANKQSLESKPQSPQHHFSTFISMQARLRPQMHECLKTKDRITCNEELLSPWIIAPHLNAEEAFLYFAFHVLERGIRCINADILMTPTTGANDMLFSQAMKFTCDDLQLYQEQPPLKALAATALPYCRQWLGPRVDSPPTRIPFCEQWRRPPGAAR